MTNDTLAAAGRQDLVDALAANDAAFSALYVERERIRREIQAVLEAAALTAKHTRLRRDGYAPIGPDLRVWVKPTDNPKYARVYDLSAYSVRSAYEVRIADGMEKGKRSQATISPQAIRAALDSLEVMALEPGQ